MYAERKEFYKKLEEIRGSKVITYVTGDRPSLETQIHNETLDFFSDHLDSFESPQKITLILHSKGGDTLAGWSIVNLIRQYTDNFEVIVPARALSTGTLICIGADKIVMTKQSNLGPIDPSINSPLNPQHPGLPATARVPVSVEAIAGYFGLAKESLKIKNQSELASIFLKLSDHVHPIALGQVYRAREQIQMLANKLLKMHMSDDTKIKNIINVLCSESGSHDYTISRREAEEDLKLPIEKPDDNNYNVIKDIFSDIRKELELNVTFQPASFLGSANQKSYNFKRALVESVEGGSHAFSTEGMFRKVQTQSQQGVVNITLNEEKNFEGWRHEP